MKKLYFYIFAKTRFWLGYSARETYGFLILMGILFLVLVIPTVWSAVYQPVEPEIQSEWLVALEKKMAALPPEIDRTKYQRRFNSNDQDAKVSHVLAPFDPNVASKETFQGLGFPSFLAERIIKYRSKGGKFRKKEDLRKMYGLSEELYLTVEPYILLPDEKIANNQPIPAKSSGKEKSKSFKKWDINTMDSTQLTYLRGIGPVMASRILKFRKKLGGFVRVEQWYEVYGLDSSTVTSLLPQLKIAPGFEPQKIKINVLDYKGLASHPYIGGKLAGVLLNYKKQHGPFKGAQDFQEIRMLDEKNRVRLVPYIDFSVE